MSALKSFAPWIAYGVVSALVDWRLAAIVALVLAISAVRSERAAEGEASILTIATAWFFGGLVTVSGLAPASPVHRYTPALSLLTLGTAAAWSLIRRRPFTETFAKRLTSPDVWNTDLFRQANMTITAVWTASFLLTGAVCALLLTFAPNATGLWLAAEAVGFVVPMRFTKIYRGRLQARRAQLAMA